jgi:DNA-binding NarL/FixJ family response regulator
VLNVALADGNPVGHGELLALLSRVDGIAVVAEAATADVLVVDGTAALEQARRFAASGAAVLVIMAGEDDESVFHAMRAGARGCLSRSASPEDIGRAVRGVAAGEMILGARIAARLTELMLRQAEPVRPPFPDLTGREREILALMARGLDNPSVARRLFLAPKTVRNNTSAIFAKLGVADRATAIELARAAGL